MWEFDPDKLCKGSAQTRLVATSPHFSGLRIRWKSDWAVRAVGVGDALWDVPVPACSLRRGCAERRVDRDVHHDNAYDVKSTLDV